MDLACGIKASPDGKKVCLVTEGDSTKAELFDFNNGTELSINLIAIEAIPLPALGVEFSPNSRLLYPLFKSDWVNQYDITITIL